MNYSEWNAVLCDHFVRTALMDSPVYLTVDGEVLRALGAAHGLQGDGAAERDLKAAVRDRVRQGRLPGDDMSLDALRNKDANGRPNGVAFLALCVLAAHNMGDNDYTETAYFAQLCELLGFTGSPRPSGMPTGSEELLWQEWARFLGGNNLLATARAGAGPTTYTHYPVSQTLLRFTDRERLQRLFSEQAFFQRQHDPDILVARLYALREGLTKRLQDKLRWTGDQFVGLTLAVADLHHAFLNSRQVRTSNVGEAGLAAVADNALLAELVRVPSGFMRPPCFQVFLRTRPGFSFDGDESPEVKIGEEWFPVESGEQSTATTAYVGHLTPELIRDGATFPLRGGGYYTKAILTKRPFRILMADPDAPDYHIYAAGRATAIGVHFLLLCASNYVADLNRLKALGKITWQSATPLGNTGWTQYENTMILDEDWTHVRAGDPDLYNSLRPKSRRTIGIAGGVKTPNGYLAGVAPQVTVFGAGSEIPVRVIALHDTMEVEVWEGTATHAVPLTIPASVTDRPCVYRIVVGVGESQTERLLRIADWDVVSAKVSTETLKTTDPLARAAW